MFTAGVVAGATEISSGEGGAATGCGIVGGVSGSSSPAPVPAATVPLLSTRRIVGGSSEPIRGRGGKEVLIEQGSLGHSSAHVRTLVAVVVGRQYFLVLETLVFLTTTSS